jgi:hypothetical protein
VPHLTKIDGVLNASTKFILRKISNPINPSNPYADSAISKDSITVGKQVQLEGTWSGETFTATSVIVSQ